VVALDAAARAEAAPRAPAAPRTTSRWVLATAAVLVLGAFVPLVMAPGIGHLSAAVMTLLLGCSAAAVGLGLGSPRSAFVATLGLMLLLGLGRLPPRAAPGYEEPQALWQTDQTIDVSVSGGTEAVTARLVVLAEPVFGGQQPPFGVAATVNGTPVAWQCPFQHGRQWLELPLDNPTASSLDVRLRLSGAPDREHNYLVVYRSANRDAYLIGLTEDPSAPAPTTTCSPRA
jgi:hypothetical protein